VSYSRVKVDFPVKNGDQLTIGQVYSATTVHQDKSSVTVELAGVPAGTNEFQIMGQGSGSTHLGITCLGIKGPPPSPPHAADCDLSPHYKLTNVWEGGAAVRIEFGQWVVGRTIHLIFWGESTSLVKEPVHAELIGSADTPGGTRISLKLANPEVKLEDVFLDADESSIRDYYISFEINPVVKHLPKIICHELWSPPPPSPAPWSPPPPPPSPTLPPPPSPLPAYPPPPVVSVGSLSCSHGASATINQVSADLSSSTEYIGKELVEVDVRLENRDSTEVVLLALKGKGIDVTNTDGAVLLPQRTIKIDDFPELRDELMRKPAHDKGGESGLHPEYALLGFALEPKRVRQVSRGIPTLAEEGKGDYRAADEAENAADAEATRSLRRASEEGELMSYGDEGEETEMSLEEESTEESFQFYVSSTAPCCIELVPTFHCR